MSRLGTNGGNAALNGLDGTGSTNRIGFAALNVSDPTTSGSGETANSGSYARQTAAWAAASGQSKANSGTINWSTLGTVAVTHFSLWDSVTYGGGNYGIGGALTSSVTAAAITAAAGAITITDS